MSYYSKAWVRHNILNISWKYEKILLPEKLRKGKKHDGLKSIFYSIILKNKEGKGMYTKKKLKGKINKA